MHTDCSMQIISDSLIHSILSNNDMIPAVPEGYYCMGKNGGNGGNHEYSKINVSIVPMENYIFLERRDFILSKNV